MHYIILPFLGLLAAGLHILFKRQARNTKIILEIVLAYGLAFNLGITALYAFMGHAFVPGKVAEYIGWPSGNPFQFEVAIANLSLGVLGILCLWFRGNFWLATIIASSVFGFGAAYGHIKDIILHHNYAPGNAGAPLYSDIIKPLVFIFLYGFYIKISKKITNRRA
jgi:hypothetical protein